MVIVCEDVDLATGQNIETEMADVRVSGDVVRWTCSAGETHECGRGEL